MTTPIKNENPRIAFFGTPELAVFTLEELNKAGFKPEVIITAPDKPKGRGLILTPPPVKIWAEQNNVPVLQPEKLDQNFIYKLKTKNYQLFIVAAYGKIIPEEILAIPKHGTLNIHPSLLPEFRGPSPVESAILSGHDKTGVSVMLLDKETDHGPILAQKEIPLDETCRRIALSEKLFRLGGEMLAETIPKWINGEIEAVPQEHGKATYSKKIAKEDGLLDLSGNPVLNYRKIRAYESWPGTYFFAEKGGRKVRVVVKDAELKDGELVIKKIIPEGKKEMDYDIFAKLVSL